MQSPISELINSFISLFTSFLNNHILFLWDHTKVDVGIQDCEASHTVVRRLPSTKVQENKDSFRTLATEDTSQDYILTE